MTISPDAWNTGSSVQVVYPEDQDITGSRQGTIGIGFSESDDSLYKNLSPQGFGISTIDNDVAGITAQVLSASTQLAENSFNRIIIRVQLRTQVTHPVTLRLSLADSTRAGIGNPQNTLPLRESTSITLGAGSPLSAEFDVRAIDNRIADGASNNAVRFSVETDDSNYKNLQVADQPFVISDDDSAGILISGESGAYTNERSTRSSTFDVYLYSQPQSDVIVRAQVSDATEGRVTPSEIVITPANYLTVAHRFTVTGVNDELADGNQSFQVTFSLASSADANYRVLPEQSRSFINYESLDSCDPNDTEYSGRGFYNVLGDGIYYCNGSTMYEFTPFACYDSTVGKVGSNGMLCTRNTTNTQFTTFDMDASSGGRSYALYCNNTSKAGFCQRWISGGAVSVASSTCNAATLYVYEIINGTNLYYNSGVVSHPIVTNLTCAQTTYVWRSF